LILSVKGIKKLYGADIVLDGVDLRVENGEKVALIGRNGSGKTTLLRIITGQLEHDGGSVTLARGAKLGYLRQEAPVDEAKTVLGIAEEAHENLIHLKQRLAELETRLADNPNDDELEEYALLHEHFLDKEGYSAEHDLRVVLQRLGFSKDDYDKPANKLSGGEKTRLALAKLLLEEPDLLILDEPTNHLDIDAVEWLEGWLRNYRGAALIISHDREFLQNTAQRIIELSDCKARSWPGPFDKFLKLREEDEERRATAYKKQQEQMAKLDEYVRRFLNSERVGQARGRLRHLNRMKNEALAAPKKDKGMSAGFRAPKRSGDIVIEAKKIGVTFGDRVLFKDVDWTVRRGERWGVIGGNGSGKTTLIRSVLDKIEPTTGTSRLGANVELGYFTQDTTDLDPERTPLEMLNWECDMEIPAARNLLGRFLFSGDQVFQTIGSLSGGEKNKLVLAKLTAMNPNLLVLDEPTNHLDMDSREALGKVLKEYNGTVVLISHDRWLLSQVADHILDIKNGAVISYPGTFSDYRRGVVPPAPIIKGVQFRDAPKVSQREISKEVQRLEKLVLEHEVNIEKQETALKEHENVLAHPQNGADLLALTKQHVDLQAALAKAVHDWEETVERLESYRAMQGGTP
jgi:ATP-binding cassette subfamily F protein 3